MLRKRIITLSAVALLAFLTMGAGDTARFNTLGHKLMCRCGCNQVLLECNHVGCTYSDTMRNELQAGLERGDSDDLILQAFVQKYGTVVLAAPTATGFNRIAWIMPFVALFGGLALVVLVVRKWRLPPPPPPPPGSAGSSDLDLYRELARKETDL
jgi:cytochrome c-type biogenesis protein CcmH